MGELKLSSLKLKVSDNKKAEHQFGFFNIYG